MKSWKTTIAGLLTGLPVALDAIVQAANSGAFTGKTGGQLVVGIGLVVFGAISKDHNVTGK